MSVVPYLRETITSRAATIEDTHISVENARIRKVSPRTMPDAATRRTKFIVVAVARISIEMIVFRRLYLVTRPYTPMANRVRDKMR
jgi:hypothetical protein